MPTRRSSPGFGAMLTPTVPSPLPVTGVVNEIQLASVATVHEQPLVADTATCSSTPAGIDGEAARPEFESAGRRLLRHPQAVVVDDDVAVPHRRQGIGRRTKLHRAGALSRGRRQPGEPIRAGRDIPRAFGGRRDGDGARAAVGADARGRGRQGHLALHLRRGRRHRRVRNRSRRPTAAAPIAVTSSKERHRDKERARSAICWRQDRIAVPRSRCQLNQSARDPHSSGFRLYRVTRPPGRQLLRSQK